MGCRVWGVGFSVQGVGPGMPSKVFGGGEYVYSCCACRPQGDQLTNLFGSRRLHNGLIITLCQIKAAATRTLSSKVNLPHAIKWRGSTCTPAAPADHTVNLSGFSSLVVATSGFSSRVVACSGIPKKPSGVPRSFQQRRLSHTVRFDPCIKSQIASCN